MQAHYVTHDTEVINAVHTGDLILSKGKIADRIPIFF